MFRKLASIALLLLSGCSPIYQAGDCLMDEDGYKEKWESTKVTKILEVGNRSYRYAFVDSKYPNLGPVTTSFSFRGVEHKTKKVPCPDSLKDVR